MSDQPTRRRRQPRRPSSSLAEKWTTLDGRNVFYRESPTATADERVMVHVHGFGLSGRYLLPTAERLSAQFHTFVPDLPGFGRSDRSWRPMDITGLAHATAAFLDDRGVEKTSLVGNSMGCPVIAEFAHLHRDRLDRAILVSPAGGVHNQPLYRAMRQLAVDGLREPTRMIPVAVPDYLRFGVPSTLRLFSALTRFPSLERLLEMDVPTLAVLGLKDPLLPGAARIREIAGQLDHSVVFVGIEGAAHAINFSHPGELAHAIRQFMDDEPIVDDPDSPGVAHVYEIERGSLTPPTSED